MKLHTDDLLQLSSSTWHY